MQTRICDFSVTLQSTLDSRAPIVTREVLNRLVPLFPVTLRNSWRSEIGSTIAASCHATLLTGQTATNLAIQLKIAERRGDKIHVQRSTNTKITKAHCGKSLIVSFHQKHKTRHSYTKDLKVVADELNVFFSSVSRNAAHAAACLAAENKITLSERHETASRPLKSCSILSQ